MKFVACFEKMQSIKKTNILMKHSFLIALCSLMLSVSVSAQETFRSVADAMRRLPAMPTVAQISSEQAKENYSNGQLATFKASAELSMLYVNSEYSALTVRMQNARQKQAQRGQTAMQQYNKNVDAGLMPSPQEMMQIVMSSGIDLEKASEQQIMDVVAGSVSKKWGISKDEYLKIVTMAQRSEKQAEAYMKANHPDLYNRLYAANAGYTPQEDESEDSRNERFGQIGDELQALQEQIVAAENKYRHPAELTEDKEWSNSTEGKQVETIETALWERVEQWTRGLDAKVAEVPYPGWWTEQRKKENALVDQWNSREAKKWMESPEAYQRELKALFDKVAALETENEQLNAQGKADNILYLMNKQKTLMFINQLMQLTVPYEDALAFPNQEHYEETGTTSFGKG